MLTSYSPLELLSLSYSFFHAFISFPVLFTGLFFPPVLPVPYFCSFVTFFRMFSSLCLLISFHAKWPLPQEHSWNTRTELNAVCSLVTLYNLHSWSSTTKCRGKHMHSRSAIYVRAHQIAAAATAPAARACIYRSCACRELVVVFENLKPLPGVELEHAVTSLNRCDRVFLRCWLCLCVI